MAPRKCRQGRRPTPFCLPSRPYSEWPSAQLLEECVRRGIRVIRKGPGSNASKDRLALALRQSDAERSPAVSLAVAGEQGCTHGNGAVVVAKCDDESILTTDDRNEAATEQESQESDEEHETPLNCEGANPRRERGEQEAGGDREPNEEQQQQRATNAEYNATFRLVNVLFSRFASRFDELMRGTIEDTDRIAKRSLWIDVSNSFHSSAPEFSRLINDHVMFADIDPSLQQQRVQSRRAIVRMWKSLSATYSRALQHARQVDADDAQFYTVCGGRLDVLYLHLWVLLKPQLATHFASEAPTRLQTTPSRSSCGKSASAMTIATNTEKPSPLTQTQEANNSKSGLKRKRAAKSTCSSLNMQQTPASKFPDEQTDPAMYTEYIKLKLEVLREKKALLAAGDARERMRFLEERRRRLSRETGELSTTVADLQQRLMQSTAIAVNWSDGVTNQDATSAAARSRITRQTAHAVGVSGADTALAELKQDLMFFSRQKRQRMADVARCDQQIQELDL